MDIDVTVAVAGHQVTQARAVGHVGDGEILTVNAALGSRPLDVAGQWAERPDVPPPDECPHAGTAATRRPSRSWTRLDVRLADGRDFDELDGTPGDGPLGAVGPHARLLEMSGASPGDPRRLRAVRHRPGARARRPAATASTTRCASPGSSPPSGCCSTSACTPCANGFGHGVVHLWAEDGTLLATASQSAIVRFWRD